MSKTSIKNKEAKAKNKEAKAKNKEAKAKNKEAKAKNKEAKAKNKEENKPTESAVSKIPNAGKCCTCRYFPAHFRGEAQPCKVLKAYVARKAEHPCWKAK